MRSRRRSFRSAWIGLLAAHLLGVSAGTQASPSTDRLAGLLDSLPGDSFASGVLYDRVLPLSHVAAFDGTAQAPAATPGAWRQMYDELWRAGLRSLGWPAVVDLPGESSGGRADDVVPILVLDARYDRLHADALESGALRPEGGQLRLAPSAGDQPWETHRVVAAACPPAVTYHGARTRFIVRPEHIFSNLPTAPPSLAIDFGDGRGFRPVTPGQIVEVSYASVGPKTLHLRLTRAGGDVVQANLAFEVRRLDTPAPDDTLAITAGITYQGVAGTGDAYVYLADGHTAIERPLLLFEGFDLTNTMNWDELYELLNRENLIETLRTRGFDAVVLNFTDATDYIQRNAFVAVELLQQVRALVGPERELVVSGASMGGLVGRYALAYMEDTGIDHGVTTFISFDSPQLGASIPLGLQYWLWFFADDSPEAAELLAALDSPAARQLLVYHYTDPPGTSGQPDPLRAALLSDLAAVGDYPALPRLVALANGSATQLDQGFSAGAQIIDWEYTSFLVDITGNVWAVPNGTGQTIFHGLIDIILLPEDEVFVNVAGTDPFDSAPGGWRDSMAELDATEAPYGDIVALHPSHCFIPSVSSLALEGTDLFHDIAGDPDLLSRTPFDVVYYPLVNEEHVDINAQNVVWLLEEIDPASSALNDFEPARGTPRIQLTSGNPLRGSLAFRISQPRDSHVRVDLIDVSGRVRAEFLDESLPAGMHEFQWDDRSSGGRALNEGVYFLRLRTEDALVARKVVLP